MDIIFIFYFFLHMFSLFSEGLSGISIVHMDIQVFGVF